MFFFGGGEILVLDFGCVSVFMGFLGFSISWGVSCCLSMIHNSQLLGDLYDSGMPQNGCRESNKFQICINLRGTAAMISVPAIPCICDLGTSEELGWRCQLMLTLL